jgi:hypothetical protein
LPIESSIAFWSDQGWTISGGGHAQAGLIPCSSSHFSVRADLSPAGSFNRSDWDRRELHF